MTPNEAVCAGVLCAGFGLAAYGAASMTRLRRDLRLAQAARDGAITAEAASTRVLRLASEELRAAGMKLLGHAGRLSMQPMPAGDSGGAEGPALHANGIAQETARILRLADDLQDHAADPSRPRVLREETLRLGPLVEEAVGVVAAMLEPSRRNWRIDPDVAGQTLLADRRALRQVLVRVLSNAARFSAHDDWVDVTLEHLEDGIAVVIEDEGAGVVSPDSQATPGLGDSRGIGLALTLARSLMEAHGGRLIVESAARIGTRVALVMPGTRVGPVRVAA